MGKDIHSRGNSKCRVPEAALVHLKDSWEIVRLELGEWERGTWRGMKTEKSQGSELCGTQATARG